VKIEGRVAVVTGAAGGIGREIVLELARRGASSVVAVDQSPAIAEVAAEINARIGRTVATGFCGDVTRDEFRMRVYGALRQDHEVATICVPAAAITRDQLAVRLDKQKGQVVIYPVETFRLVTEINLIAPVYWALEMVAGIADRRRQSGKGRWEPEEDIQGTVVFIGSVSSLGNKGQIAYAATKAALEGVTATLMMEAIFHGVRCGILHPGYTRTPMVQALDDRFIQEQIIPRTQLRRLIEPAEIADAVCFMIANSAVSGSLWADAGYQPAI
jgi:3-oxoacyl-[acyl-carrier protein] reductase